MPILSELRARLAARDAAIKSRSGARDAAVAVIFRERDGGEELLFIERAHRQGDPWSGHMAFPGGRLDADDASLRAAAERETREEVGVDLSSAQYLGRLDDLEGGPKSGLRIVVSAYVYQLSGDPMLTPNAAEVADVFWFPAEELFDSARHVDARIPMAPKAKFPGILVGAPDRHIVWGLTYRFLEILLALVDRPLPVREEFWGYEEGSSPLQESTGKGG